MMIELPRDMKKIMMREDLKTATTLILEISIRTKENIIKIKVIERENKELTKMILERWERQELRDNKTWVVAHNTINKILTDLEGLKTQEKRTAIESETKDNRARESMAIDKESKFNHIREIIIDQGLKEEVETKVLQGAGR